MRGRRVWVGLAAIVVTLSLSVPAPAQQAGYDQPYRPQVSFSPQHNWTNDPNGLVFLHGEYHLFYQYNPFGNEWGHMSWGHAVSTDLLHWKELPVALPEANGTMIFTGSVVVDRTNSSGFCTPAKDCLVAIYTGHTPRGNSDLQTQNLAFSTDNGRTWTKYEGNPVLDLHLANFRDPSVFWDGMEHHWVMAVALPKEHKVRFYASPNLKQWTPLSEFGPAGDVAGDWECPDLLHIPAAGGHGKGRWALKVGLSPGAPQGGSGEQYFLGDFDGHQFTAATTPGAHGWTNYGKDDYCAISFNGLPSTQKPVLIGWMNNWDYAKYVPTSPWRGQMSLLRRLSLLTDDAGEALVQEPVIAPLRRQRMVLSLSAGNTAATTPTTVTTPFELEVTLPRTEGKTVALKLSTDSTHWTEIGFDLARNVFFLDRRHSGEDLGHSFAVRTEAPLAATRPLDLHLIVDRLSIQAFAQGGTLAMTNMIFAPAQQNRIELQTGSAKPIAVTGSLWPLRSIWAAPAAFTAVK